MSGSRDHDEVERVARVLQQREPSSGLEIDLSSVASWVYRCPNAQFLCEGESQVNPLVHRDVAIVQVAVPGGLVGVSVENGAALWETSLAEVSTVCPSAGAGVVVAYSAGSLVGVDVGAGTRVWEHALGTPTKDAVSPQPVVCGNEVLSGDWSGSVVALSLESGKTAWARKIADAGVPIVSIACHEQTVVASVSDGHVVGLQRASGIELWRQRVRTSQGCRIQFSGPRALSYDAGEVHATCLATGNSVSILNYPGRIIRRLITCDDAMFLVHSSPDAGDCDEMILVRPGSWRRRVIGSSVATDGRALYESRIDAVILRDVDTGLPRCDLLTEAGSMGGKVSRFGQGVVLPFGGLEPAIGLLPVDSLPGTS